MSLDQLIKIYYHSKKPRGLQSVVKESGLCRIHLAPRDKSELKHLRHELEGASNPLNPSRIICVYFLKTGKTLNSSLEIGQTKNLKERLNNRNRTKWWSQIIIISSTNSTLEFDSPDIEYLEARFIQQAEKARKVILKNKNRPSPNHLVPRARERQSSLDKLYEEALEILSIIGISDFEASSQPDIKEVPSIKPPTRAVRNISKNASPNYKLPRMRHNDGIFVLKFDNVEAYGKKYKKGSKKFVVLANSPSRGGRRDNRTWKDADQALLQRLRSDGTIVPDGNRFRFTKNYVFSSMSSAAKFVFGSSVSGPLYWKPHVLHYVLKFDGVEAHGKKIQKDGKEFIVLANSLSRGGRKGNRTWKGTDQALLQKLLNDGTIVSDRSHCRFTADYTFSSMSSAARFILGSVVSGPARWKPSA